MGMGDEMAWRMLRQANQADRTPIHRPGRLQPKPILITRVIPTYNDGLCNWPEKSPYGSLSFHLHIRQIVALWNDFPSIGNPTAMVDTAAENLGYTIVHFDSDDECHRFLNQHMLHDAIVTRHFEGVSNGYVQFRNTYPRELIDNFLRTVVQGNHDLQIAVTRISEMMQSSRTAMFSIANRLDTEKE